MRAVVARVSSASVTIGGNVVGEIEKGLLVLVGSQCGDGDDDIRYIVEKTVNLRIFEDADGKMNRSLLETGGGILVVSQFTLLGDARKGRRPSFIEAEHPDKAVQLYQKTIEVFRTFGMPVEQGVFGADMDVASVNDGPVTILLDSKKLL